MGRSCRKEIYASPRRYEQDLYGRPVPRSEKAREKSMSSFSKLRGTRYEMIPSSPSETREEEMMETERCGLRISRKIKELRAKNTQARLEGSFPFSIFPRLLQDVRLYFSLDFCLGVKNPRSPPRLSPRELPPYFFRTLPDLL